MYQTITLGCDFLLTLSGTELMKVLSGDGLIILSAALLFTGIASATKTDQLKPAQATSPTYTASGSMSKKSALLLTNLLRNPHLQVKATVGNQQHPNIRATSPTYTASGTMSKKSALLLTNLLRNPHLKVKAIAGNQQPQSQAKRPMDVSVRYTIKGTTDRQTVLKLKRLLKNSKNIQIIAHANVNLPSRIVRQQPRSNAIVQPSRPFIGAYKPFYYKGTPPVYIQGNTMWYPIPVRSSASQNHDQAPFPMNYSLKVAGK